LDLFIGQVHKTKITNLKLSKVLQKKINYVMSAFNIFQKQLNICSHDYILKMSNCNYNVILETSKVEVDYSNLFTQDIIKNHYRLRESVFGPEVKVFNLKNATIRGESNLIYMDDCIIHHNLINIEKDYLSEELHRKIHINTQLLTAKPFFSDCLDVYNINTVAFFTDAGSRNYAHWLTEVLPRIVVFCEIPEYRHIPLVIDSCLHTNMLWALDYAIDHGRVVYMLGANSKMLVNNLFVVSPAGYVPFEPRPGQPIGGSHGIFNQNAILLTRKKFQNFMPSNYFDHFDGEKIYLARNKCVRAVINEDEIIDLMNQSGFKIVDPESLSFDQQVTLFSRANIIVSPTGAALANMIFAPRGARIVILAAANPALKYKYWQILAGMVDCKVTYVLGQALEEGFHSNFTIEVSNLIEALHAVTPADKNATNRAL
jgi:hypothetical protein